MSDAPKRKTVFAYKRPLDRDAAQWRHFHAKANAKLQEIRLKIRALEMEKRAIHAEMELEKIMEGPNGFQRRAQKAKGRA